MRHRARQLASSRLEVFKVKPEYNPTGASLKSGDEQNLQNPKNLHGAAFDRFVHRVDHTPANVIVALLNIPLLTIKTLSPSKQVHQNRKELS
jgi:hypothetical protein